ncbi:MAG: GNAT family N-acetyltransferase [Oscillospiraceae bacterium]|nr:GNAT family N-acetyltransferase [Oscillospiraceae bacterium]
MDGDMPAGFVCVNPRFLEYPLERLKEAYIDDLEVHENYRRQGIGQHMIECAEDWARKAGFKQIRTHSNNKAVEAIHMWHKLNYGLSPHDYHEYEPETDEYKNLFSGYLVAKILNSAVSTHI